jgi:hypothetical protein
MGELGLLVALDLVLLKAKIPSPNAVTTPGESLSW